MTDQSSYPSVLDPDEFFLPAKNNKVTTLNSALIVTNNNSINVESTSGFPSEGIVSVGEEVIYYRSITSSSFRNLTRGFDNTTAAHHSAGSEIELRWVAGHHNRAKNTIQAIETTLGVNPQGSFPDVSSRLDATLQSVTRRTDQKMFEPDGTTEAPVGYGQRMFRCSDEFIALGTDFSSLAAEVHIDGLRQERSRSISLLSEATLDTVTVNAGSGKGRITITGADIVAAGVTSGDMLVLKGTPTNDNAYIIDSVISTTEVEVNQIIVGSDQISPATGSADFYAVNDATYPMEDYIVAQVYSTGDNIADAILFKEVPDSLEEVRADYHIASSVSLSYDKPISVVAEYENPNWTGLTTVSASGGTESFSIDFGQERAIVFAVKLQQTNSPKCTNASIEIFGKADETERQYLAEFINLSLGDFEDNGVFHFTNRENLTHFNVRITNNDPVNSLEFFFEIECEGLGNNA